MTMSRFLTSAITIGLAGGLSFTLTPAAGAASYVRTAPQDVYCTTYVNAPNVHLRKTPDGAYASLTHVNDGIRYDANKTVFAAGQDWLYSTDLKTGSIGWIGDRYVGQPGTFVPCT
jgi:hypothetical protein